MSCGASVLVAVRADQLDGECGFPSHAQMLLTLSRLDPVPLEYELSSRLRGPSLRAKLRELGVEALQEHFERTVAARVAAARAAARVCTSSVLSIWLKPCLC